MNDNNKRFRSPNIEAERRQRMDQARQRKKQMMMQQRHRQRLLKRRLAAILTCSVLLFFSILISLLVWLRVDSGMVNRGNITRQFRISENGVEAKNHAFLYRNKAYYTALSSLTDLYGYSISGDKKEMVITLANQDTAAFEVGTDRAKINGISVFLGAPTFLSADELYVPVSFFGEYMTGSKLERKTDKKTETAVLSVQAGDKEQAEEFAFTITGNKTTPPISESDTYGSRVQNYEYKIDITPYEAHINPPDRDAYLFLVDTSHPLAKDYLPGDLADLIFTRRDGRSTQKMRLDAAMSLEAMLKEAAANGYDDLSVTSAYRSYDYQKLLFDNQVASYRATYGDNAQAKAAESVARPGTSEHQSGLCADLHNLSEASQAFANTEAYRWLFENCSKFGFILRYPNGKQSITGIIFEPWHYRYVGRYHAEKIMGQGLALEEYLNNR